MTTRCLNRRFHIRECPTGWLFASFPRWWNRRNWNLVLWAGVLWLAICPWRWELLLPHIWLILAVDSFEFVPMTKPSVQVRQQGSGASLRDSQTGCLKNIEKQKYQVLPDTLVFLKMFLCALFRLVQTMCGVWSQGTVIFGALEALGVYFAWFWPSPLLYNDI